MNEATKLQTFHVPTDYPNGVPLLWMHEVSGVLQYAMTAFLNREHTCTPDQFRLVKEYIAHWINAPWKWKDAEFKPSEYIELLDQAQDRDGVWRVLDRLLDVGIDPL